MQKISEDDLRQVRDGFYRRGESIADWSRRRGFPPNTVYQILSGRCHALRGRSHLIAVELGLKAAVDTADELQLNERRL